jgi:hypothetical protein
MPDRIGFYRASPEAERFSKADRPTGISIKPELLSIGV